MKRLFTIRSKDLRSGKGKQRGIALVTVMSILAVLTILTVAILSLAGNELRSARAYSDNVRVRQLSETVISMVIGQVREATNPTTKIGGSLFGGGAQALWASQPGMIRTFEDGGKLVTAFKLYSSGKMTIDSEQDLRNEPQGVQAWEQFPERFVDLNAPSIAYDTRGIETERYFPILDPRLMSIDGVEGFKYESFPGVQADRRLPMPVEWIYVLKDGTMGTLDESGRFVSTDPTASPALDNPIQARIAFWADDETCKINLNTAAEAVPWILPRAYTEEARDYSRFQPVTNEVQRYPGHPATTCLSTVLFPGKYADGSGADELSSQELEAIMELTPKVQWGGTEDGTKAGRERIEYDQDRLYASVDDVLFDVERAENRFLQFMPNGVDRLERAKGLFTTRSYGPELNVHGRPRIAMWPIAETTSSARRTTFDDTIAFCTTLRGNRDKYFFQRNSANSRHAEFYVWASRQNVNLYQYLMAQVYKNVPGSGKSLAEKYGSSNGGKNYTSSFYSSDDEYYLDHFAIGCFMFDYIRQTNLHDGNVTEPYARLGAGDNDGFGQISGINMIGRNLDSSDGSSDQNSRWHAKTLEPRGSGRMYTISEVALVAYGTSAVVMESWNGGNPTFTNAGGGSGDHGVVENILSNDHPRYAQWLGRPFAEIDQGATFTFVEVGIIPEMHAPAQGFHQIHPKQTVRLLQGGTGYAGGLTDGVGLRLRGSSFNGPGVPLELWGESVESASNMPGPAISSMQPGRGDARGDLPAGWFGWGGQGGYRLMRFGTFTVGGAGDYGSAFRANGTGPLSHFYCQTPVIIKEGDDLVFQQDEPIQLCVYDIVGPGADTGNLVQVFNLRWADPGEQISCPAPKLNSSSYAGWTRRFREAAAANARVNPVPVLEQRENTEVVKSLVVSHSDVRHVAGRRNVPSELMTRHLLFSKRRASHSLTWAVHPGSSTLSPGATFLDDYGDRNLVENVNYPKNNRPDFTNDPKDRRLFAPLLSPGYSYPIDPTITRDFDNGVGGCPDGPYINKPDDGADDVPGSSAFNQKYPYFDASEWDPNKSYEDRNLENFSPNRMIASPVAFGSLPSAMQANAPWTCLLFRPHVSSEADRSPHLGEAGQGLRKTGDKTTVDGFQVPQFNSQEDEKFPADHLWLDLFWMPIVEPYPISEPFATSGKVNLNYQMMPFDYIKRATALHAVLKSERILAIPNTAAGSYKEEGRWNANYFHKIDADETLKQWEAKFEDGKIFKTGTEVCEMFLYPKDEVRFDERNGQIRRWWDRHKLTGDNSLEQPYANIYPRITTKSNTFKVYMTVQTLQKTRGTQPNEWVSGTDQVTGEYRGSAVIERFLDPNDDDIPNYRDYKADPRAESLEYYYQYRVVNNKQFVK